MSLKQSKLISPSLTCYRVVLVFFVVLIIVLFVVFYMMGAKMFILASIPASILLYLFVSMLIFLKKYEVSDNGLLIGSERIPWGDILEINLKFQSRSYIHLKYRSDDNIKNALLVAKIECSRDSFIPDELKEDFSSDLEMLLRAKTGIERKGKGKTS